MVSRSLITLNDKEYRLARRQVSELTTTGRNWQMERVPVTTERKARTDVKPGEIRGEYIITYNTWDGGLWGDSDAPPGTYHNAYGIETRNSGKITLANKTISTYIPYGLYPIGRDPCKILNFLGEDYLLAGRYCFKWSDGDWAVDNTFYRLSNKYGEFKYGEGVYGSGYNLQISDGIVFGDRLIVAVRYVDGSDESIWVKYAGSWTQSSNVTARHVTIVEDMLWRGYHADVITITTSNDDLIFTDRIGGADLTASVAVGIYTYSDLASTLQTAINAASTVKGFVVSWSFENERYTISRDNYITIVNNTNDYIDFKEDAAGGELQADIVAGTYHCSDLCTAIETAMDTAGADTYTVTYSTSTRKFTITSDGDYLSILWNTGTHNPGGGTPYSAGPSLGFTAADDTDSAAPISISSDQDACMFTLEWNDALTTIEDVLGFDNAAADTGAHTYTGDTAPTFDTGRSLAQVSSVPLGVDITDSAQWSVGINVGTPNHKITALSSVGSRLLVSKEEGLFAGDARGVFPNLLPEMYAAAHRDNGRGTYVMGSEIFYPWRNGMRWIRFGNAPVISEVGPGYYLNNSVQTTELAQIGTVPTAICGSGEWVYVAVEPNGSWLNSGGVALSDVRVFLTTNGALDYTSYGAPLSDGLITTTMPLDSLDTWANGDAILIGYTDKFYGVKLHIKNPNTNTSQMVVEYWNGRIWVAFESLASDYITAVDYTQSGGITLDHSGEILWRDAPALWANDFMGSYYCIRLRFLSQLSGTVDVVEASVLPTKPYCYILAGRKRRTGDPGDSAYIWHSIGRIAAPRITAISTTTTVDGCNAVIFAGRQISGYIVLDDSPAELPSIGNTEGYILLPFNDGGTPHTNKEWIDITVYGLPDSSSWADCARFSYRTNSDAGFTDIGDATQYPDSTRIDLYTELGSRPTGYRAQYALTISGASAVPADRPEIYKIEIRYRELPVYKNQYRAIIELGATTTPQATQLSNLEDVMGTAVTLRDPAGLSKTVTVNSMQVTEISQEGLSYPVLIAEIGMTEC